MDNKNTYLASCFVFLTFVVLISSQLFAEEIDFERDIAPILEDNCWYCHGEDEDESGLRLDQRMGMLKGGDSGIPALVPGKPEKSYLLDVINHVDEDMAMPPDEDKLDEEDIELLTRWVKEGAVWPGQMQELVKEKSDHWSFQPIVRPEVPDASKTAIADASNRPQNPIDAFLLERLAKDSLTYSEPADARSLIRRASIVLTGIAPTAEDTKQFVSDFEKSPEKAYTELVDLLMASPHFGERWAQHWLDVIRWAETNGSESNAYRKNAWIYRDYVIRAFNEDKPYDQFLFDQIAGDTVGQGDATGYLVAGPHVPLATVGKEESARRQARADRMDEVLQTVGATALGVTIGCARCHNHKFDPISISDYYSISAVFQDVEFGGRFPEMSKDHPRRLLGNELHERIKEQRIKVRNTGPWEEDWTGYREIHMPFVEAKSVRITFQKKFVRIDEMEIFGTKEWNRNLALASNGTQLDGSHEITAGAFPLKRINDGEYGNDSWFVRGKHKGDAKPWVQFTFEEPQEIFRIRLSTNREDFMETDYLLGLGNQQFGPFTVEVQNEDGEWKTVFSPTKLKELNKQYPERAEWVEQIQELIDESNESGPKPGFVGRFIKPVKTFVLGRGSPENPRDEVFASGLSELGGDLGLEPDASGPQRRSAFANWTTAKDNPLTSRVAANRLWHHVFGRGIVTTTSDFGIAGSMPTHPKLLDWLASELMEPTFAPAEAVATNEPWSMKHLIRMMVTTEAFKQSSLPKEAALKIDGDSALLWRFPPKRVEAEVIRDSVLQASGILDRTVGGRSYRIHNIKKRYAQWEVTDNYGPDTWRRMIYQERMRRVDDQMFTAFDFPDCGQVRAKRPVSTTPLQALNLMNSNFVIDQSKRLAERAQKDAGDDETKSVDRCFELLLGRTPEEDERQACLELARSNGLSFVCRALINSNEFAFLP